MIDLLRLILWIFASCLIVDKVGGFAAFLIVAALLTESALG